MHQLTRSRLEHACRGRKHACQRRSAATSILQLGNAVFQRRAEVGHKVGNLVAVHVVKQVRSRRETDVVDRLSKGLVNLRLNSARALLGHNLSNGVELLILVVLNARVLNLSAEQRHHIGAKVLGNNNGCVVFAGLYTLNGLILVHKGPVKAIVCAQRINNRLANIHAHRHQVTLVALIGIGHGHLKVAGIAVRIPAACNVKPCVKAGHDYQTNYNDKANHAVADVLQVTTEEFKDVLHLGLTAFLS